jgi:purine-binding chemotaxis protein CheW
MPLVSFGDYPFTEQELGHFLLQLLQKTSDLVNVDSPGEHTENLLVFHLSGMDCAFPLSTVKEVVPMAQLSSPPGLPSLLAGFLDLGGTAIPILRLDRLFNLPEQVCGLYTPLIILRGRQGPIGILTGGVRRIVKATEWARLTIPGKNIFQDCASGAVEAEGTVLHLLSPNRILLENERGVLAEFQEMAQQRLNHLKEGM